MNDMSLVHRVPMSAKVYDSAATAHGTKSWLCDITTFEMWFVFQGIEAYWDAIARHEKPLTLEDLL